MIYINKESKEKKEDIEFIDFMNDWARHKSQTQSEIVRKRDMILSASNYQNQHGVFLRSQKRFMKKKDGLKNNFGYGVGTNQNLEQKDIRNEVISDRIDMKKSSDVNFLRTQNYNFNKTPEYFRASVESNIFQKRYMDIKSKNSNILNFKTTELKKGEQMNSLSVFSPLSGIFGSTIKPMVISRENTYISNTNLPSMPDKITTINLESMRNEMNWIKDSLNKKGLLKVEDDAILKGIGIPETDFVKGWDKIMPKRGNFLQRDPFNREEAKRKPIKKKS